MATVDAGNVVDFTEDPECEDDGDKIRLKTGIDLSHIQDGILFEPEMDETLLQPRYDETSYFMQSSEKDFDEVLKNFRIELEEDADSDDDNGEDLTRFQRLARKMQNVTSDGGVKKRIIKSGLLSEGEVGPAATVTLHYSLYLEDEDEPYDSTVLRGRAERFKLDSGMLVGGLELAVKSMTKGERSEFLIESNYAYGNLGCPPRVPPKAQIRAKVELLHFAQEAEADALLAVPAGERYKAKTYDDIERIAGQEHIEGNGFVNSKDFSMAARRYGRGIRLLEDAELKNESEEKRQKHLLLKLYLNRSHCFIKMQMGKKACLDLQKALAIEPRSAKALYRVGRAKRILGNHSEAESYLKRAQKIEPNNADIGQELVSLNDQIRKEQEAERVLYQKMITGKADRRAEKSREAKVASTHGLEDEFFAELESQMRAFVASASDSWKLPGSLSKDVVALAEIRSRAADYNLVLKEERQGSRREVWLEKSTPGA